MVTKSGAPDGRGKHPNSMNRLKPLAKGNRLNPYGLGALPPELRGIRAMHKREVAVLIGKVARMNAVEMSEAAADAKTSALEAAVIAVFKRAIEKGDGNQLSLLLDRCIGRVDLVVTDQTESDNVDVAAMSTAQLWDIVKRVIPPPEDPQTETSEEIKE